MISSTTQERKLFFLFSVFLDLDLSTQLKTRKILGRLFRKALCYAIIFLMENFQQGSLVLGLVL